MCDPFPCEDRDLDSDPLPGEDVDLSIVLPSGEEVEDIASDVTSVPAVSDSDALGAVPCGAP